MFPLKNLARKGLTHTHGNKDWRSLPDTDTHRRTTDHRLGPRQVGERKINFVPTHYILPGIEYSRHVTPWAISRAPHYRLKSIKVFSLITSRILPKKGMDSGKYMTFLKIIHTSMTRYICALAVLFLKIVMAQTTAGPTSKHPVLLFTV